jgi:hypothetical protein
MNDRCSLSLLLLLLLSMVAVIAVLVMLAVAVALLLLLLASFGLTVHTINYNAMVQCILRPVQLRSESCGSREWSGRAPTANLRRTPCRNHTTVFVQYVVKRGSRMKSWRWMFLVRVVSVGELVLLSRIKRVIIIFLSDITVFCMLFRILSLARC